MRKGCIVMSGLFLGLLLSTNLLAQKQLADSLENVLLKENPQDTTRVNLLIDMSFAYTPSDLEKVKLYADEALALADKIKYTKGIVEAYNRLGAYYEFNREHDSAINHHRKSIKANQKLNDLPGLAGAYYGMGYNLYLQGKLDSGLLYLEKGAYYHAKSNNIRNQAVAYLIMGEIYRIQGNYVLAIDFLQKAKATFMRSDAAQLVVHTDYRLGDLHFQMGNLVTSENHLNQALKEAKRLLALGNERMEITIPICLQSLGSIYKNTGDYSKALEFYDQVAAIHVKKDHQHELAILATDQAEVYLKLNKYDRALGLLMKSRKTLIDSKTSFNLDIVNRLIGEVYLKQKKYNLALQFANEAIEMAEKQESLPSLSDDYKLRSNIHSAMGNYKKAYESHVQYKVLSDSVVNKDNIQKVTNLEAQYKFDQEKEEIRIEQEKKDLLTDRQILQAEAQRNYLIGGVLFVLLLAGAIARAYYGRKKAADVLRKLNDEIAQVNQKLKMTDQYRTRFFANINHDIRTPLTLIRGYHEQIIRDENNYLSDGSEKHLRYLKKNTDTLYHMSQEIQNLTLLDESKLSLSWQAVEIVSLTNSLTNMFHSRADLERKSISCVDLPEEEITVHLDRAQFERILGNMLSNAFKYSDEGASISVSCKAENEMLYFEVTDTGYGISEEHLPHIFDRFYQSADNPYKTQQGVGLGLALVKELVVLHGGELSVISKFGEGSTFSFSLPYNLDKEVSETVAEEAMSQLPGTETIEQAEASNPIVASKGADKTHTVLIVDDHEEIRDYIVSIIGAQYHIKQAAHGQQALELLEKEKVDLVITDLMMPWLDGFGLVEQMQENEKLKHIPVMVVSARTTDEDKMKILNSGINEFMTKPFSPVEMEQRIENMLTQKDSTDVWSHLSKDKELRSNLEEDILKKVHALVLKKIDDGKLTVAVLAAELCASERKVHDLINDLAGMPPKTYIRSIRLEYAKHLIDTQKVTTASEAAQSIGMNNSTQFKNQYVKKFGVEPFG